MSELSDEDRRALARLGRLPEPDPGREDRIVERLRGAGLLRPGPERARRPAALKLAAALLMGLALGWWLRSPSPLHPDYLLLLYSPSAPEDGVENVAARVREYAQWADDRAAVVVDGARLGDGARISPETGTSDVDAGKASSVAGYFRIAAQSLEQARRVASTCPHLKYGGSIEVRAISSGAQGR